MRGKNVALESSIEHAMPDASSPSVSSATADSAIWRKHADELAEKFVDLFAHRRDAYGGYRKQGDSVVARCVKQPLTVARITRHLKATTPDDLVGAYTTTPDNECRWLCVDVDAHEGDGADSDRNERYAIGVWMKLEDLGFAPLLFQSNGCGGFHCFVWFDRLVPARDVCCFGRWLLRECETGGVKPEFFPKQESVAGRYGNWVRLPGRHHTRGHYHRAWSGEGWLDVIWTIRLLLAVEPDEPGVMTDPAFQIASPVRTEPVLLEPGERLPLSNATIDLIAHGANPLTRNRRLFVAACDMLGCGYSPTEILSRLEPPLLRSGLDVAEISRTVQSACGRPRSPARTPNNSQVVTAWKRSTLPSGTSLVLVRRPWRRAV